MSSKNKKMTDGNKLKKQIIVSEEIVPIPEALSKNGTVIRHATSIVVKKRKEIYHER